jgi:hypothetical protein
MTIAEEYAEKYHFSVPAGQFEALPLVVSDIGGFYMFDVHVVNAPSQDIQVLVVGAKDFYLFSSNFTAMRAGAHSERLPGYSAFISSRVQWGTFSFSPELVGQYYLVLDNTFSSFKAKEVDILVYWMAREWPIRRVIRQATVAKNWPRVWTLFEQTENYLIDNRLSDACYSMRDGLAVLWVEVCKDLCGTAITFDSGKPLDISRLKQGLGTHVPAFVKAQLGQAYALASELGHREKRGGQDPPLNEVMLAFRIVFSSSAYLVSLCLASG